MVKVKENMTGWKMWEHGVPNSRLTVVRQTEDYVDKNGKHYAQWLCECNCGSGIPVVTRSVNLKNGNTKSCGCFNIECIIQRNQIIKKKHNKYDLSGEYGIGYCSNTESPFYFDLEDYDLIKDYCWHEVVDSKNYHSLRAYDSKTSKHICMQWLILGKNIDHQDLNPLNNRKSNLRPATYKENSQNGPKRKNNTSGVTGVCWSASANQWWARIQRDGKEINLGFFTDKKDAIRARLVAEKQYYGQFASQQHLFEQYGIEVKTDAQ